MQTKTKKIMASLIVFIMLLANMSPLGIHFGEVIASSNLNDQNSKTNNENVEFDVYFLNNERETHEVTKNIGEENKVMAKISVKNTGYLKDAMIEFVDPNFKFAGEINSEMVASADESSIRLNQVNAGDEDVIELPFIFNHEEEISLERFDKISVAKLSGTYMDAKGKERAIEKEIKLNLKWTAEAESTVKAEVSKYLQYDIKGEKGVILQLTVKEAIKDNILPVKESKLEIAAPKINGVMPQEASVYSELTEHEANFDEKTGKVEIVAKNDADAKNEIDWKVDSQREYEITYKYPESAISEGETTTKIVINSDTKVYAAEEKDVKANLDDTVALEGQLGKIVDLEVEADAKLSKGNMYANFDREEKEEIPFAEKISADISLPELIDQIVIDLGKDIYTRDDSRYEANTQFKALKLTKNEIKEFFGDEGSVSVYAGEELIKKIDATIEDDEIIIEVNSENIKLVTTKPLKSGKFIVEAQKAIKGETSNTIEEVGIFNRLNTNSTLMAASSDIVIAEKEAATAIELVEPEYKADLVLSNPNLSTMEVNEDVEIKAVLRTDSEYNKLYKNPVIVIDVPEYVEQISVKSAQLLFDDELTVKSCTLDGRRFITELEGVQTKYNLGGGYEGTTLLFEVDLVVNNLTPKSTLPMVMTVISEDQQLQKTADVNFIAPTGVVTVNKITDIDEGEDLVALTEDEKTTLDVKQDAKNVTEEIKIINNNDNEIKNVSILGRTLATDTTDTDTGVELDNTLDVPMISGINTNGLEGVTVYYSANGKATKDLDNPENGWSTEVADVTQVKSYLIKLDENASMQVGETATFTYDMQIPANLDYAKESKSAYTVFFDNVQDDQTTTEKATSKKLAVGTSGKPTLEISLSSYSPENSIVREGQIVKYVATIKNTGVIDAKNVRLNVTAPDITAYKIVSEEDESVSYTTDPTQVENPEDSIAYEYSTKHTLLDVSKSDLGYKEVDDTERTIMVGKIAAGEEKKVEFELTIKEYEKMNYSEDVILKTAARVIANEMNEELVSNEYSLKLADSDLSLVVARDNVKDEPLTKGLDITYDIYIKNISNETTLENVTGSFNAPNGLKIVYANDEYFGDSNVRILTNLNDAGTELKYSIDNLPPRDTVILRAHTTIVENTGLINAVVSAQVGSESYVSNYIENTTKEFQFEFTQKQPDNAYVKEGDEVTVEYTIKNLTDVEASELTFKNIIPDNMTITEIYSRKEGSTDIDNDLYYNIAGDEERTEYTITTELGANEGKSIFVTLKAGSLPNGVDEKQVENYGTVSINGQYETTSNKVIITIERDKSAKSGTNTETGTTPGPIEDPTKTGTSTSDDTSKYVVSGIAWVDKNQNGERNDGEELVSGIEVRLLNNKSKEVVKTTTTSNNGEYTFSDVENGEYLVVFLYDTSKYVLTQYKKSGVSLSTNSDVVDVKMNINGKQTQVASSDEIVVSNDNVRNIDIGLCSPNKSDLKLDKYISKVTVSYSGTVKNYSYDQLKLAKVEIPANQLSKATVIVEYKIVVTNIGATTNYVKKIIDYVPNGMTFSSELNKDWYKSTNGNLFNSSLAETKLAPGDSKEVSLTLTKKMTDTSTGIVNNNAELYEVYNESGIKDTNSTPGNKVSGENDMSAADLVISVKTGDAVLYTSIISVTISVILAVGVFFIRKTVLTKVDNDMDKEEF